MRFWRKNFLPVFLFFVVASCTSTDEQANKIFEKKYGAEVLKIQAERTPPKEKPQMMHSSPPSAAEVQEILARDQDFYPYVDIAKFGEKFPQSYAPNAETYEQLRAANPSNSLPPNIFEVTYNTALYPPFQRIGAEFDTIQVPVADVYGVKTAMSDKAYLLAGGDAMKRSIDLINNEKTAQDVEISEVLIKEKKRLERERKTAKIFGIQDQVELASLEKKGEKKIEEDPKNNSNEARVDAASGLDKEKSVASKFIIGPAKK